jgi:hypothetical protein
MVVREARLVSVLRRDHTAVVASPDWTGQQEVEIAITVVGAVQCLATGCLQKPTITAC